MKQGARRAALGGFAITMALGILPAMAGNLLPLAPGGVPDHALRIEVAQLMPITVVPYRWTARKTSDGSIVLSGYQPDTATRTALLKAAGAQALDASSIAGGAPEDFAASARTALELLALFDDGAVDLSGSVWTVTGRIESLEAAQNAKALIEREGLDSKGWVFDLVLPQNGGGSGDKPDADGAAADGSQTATSDSSPAIETLPSASMPRAPSVERLTADGAASDSTAPTVSASDSEQVAPADDALVASDALEDLAPAPVPAFSFAAMKQGEKWLVAGNAPIDAFQRLLDIHLDISSGGRLTIVPAPEGFGADALKALDVLATLESGRVLFDGSTWMLAGLAANEAVASQARKAVLDEGFVGDISVSSSDTAAVAHRETEQATLATPEVSAPAESPTVSPALSVASPYVWQAELSGDGQIDFSGHVPSADVKDYLDNQSRGGRNSVGLADGAPDGFSGNVLAGLDALKQLASGEVGFDGTSWRLVGVAADAFAAERARASLGARTDTWTVEIAAPPAETASAEPAGAQAEGDEGASEPAGAQPETDVAAASDTMQGASEGEASPPARADFADLGLSTEPTHPKPPPPPPLPTVTPYTWQAKLQPDGAMDFSGYVPAEALRRYLDVRSKGGNNDTRPAGGAPEGFVGDVLAGLDALSELETGRLDFDGTSWSLTGATGDEAAKSRALASLGALAESWAVAIATPQPPPAPPARPKPLPVIDKGAPDFTFTAEKTGEGVVELSGDVPADATRAYLGVIAGASGANTLTVRPGAPGAFVAAAAGGLRVLLTLDSGKLVYEDFAWSLAGKSASDTTRSAASAAVSALPGGEDWSIDIVPPTPLEICEAEVATFDERNAILFDAGSSRIAQASLPAIDEIAETLKSCPSAVIHVEGHTDSDGDAESNLILSVSRAEAVADKLIALGVGEDRIYAIGYGESLPIASNDNRDGKSRNRRIVIMVSGGPE